MEQPIVSILCTVYNHERFLHDCLEGFVMQKTNFAFEAIVHDDASTDNSANIIKEYADKYPDIIKPIFETENQYSKKDGTLDKIMKNAISQSVKYIAICEGDDYWTNPNKLQLQVEFLENHPDYTMCFHRVVTKYEKGTKGKDIFKDLKQGEYTVNDVIKCWLVPTCSILYRENIIDKIPFNKDFKVGDNVLVYTCLSYGKIYCIKGIYAVYRKNINGWTEKNTSTFISENLFIHSLALIDSFPNLDFDSWHKINIPISCEIFVNDKTLLNRKMQNEIKLERKRYPFRFAYILAKKYIKKKLRRL